MYLVTEQNKKPFLTPYYEDYNFYCDGMIVYNLNNETYTTDGINWQQIDVDHL